MRHIQETTRLINSEINGLTVDDIKIGDVKWLKRQYRMLNMIYFGSELPENLDFEWSKRMVRTAGMCEYQIIKKGVYKPEKIKMSESFIRKNPNEFYEILLHEMIHVKLPGAKHGKLFYQEMERLNKTYGLNITRHTKNRAERPHTYRCKSCGAEIKRVNRFNVLHYFCSRCKTGRFELVKTEGGK